MSARKLRRTATPPVGPGRPIMVQPSNALVSPGPGHGPLVPSIWASKIMDTMTRTPNWAKDGEQSPIDQIHRYLVRLRQAVPFPADPTDVYFTCFPPWMREWWDKGYFSQNKPKDLPAHVVNMLRIMLQKKEARILRGGGGLHKPEDVITKVVMHMDGSGREEVFWITVPFEAPFSKNFNDDLLYPPDGPDFIKLKAWHSLSVQLEEEIGESMNFMKKLQPFIPSPIELRALFPELCNFIRYSNQHTPSGIDREMRVKLQVAVKQFDKPELREKLVASLSAALMLPDKDPVAWIGHVSI